MTKIDKYDKNGKKCQKMTKNDKNRVIDLMTNQKEIINKGGTMRLGAWDCEILKDTKSSSIYSKKLISERHRHRYEFNNDYNDKIFDGDFVKAGVNPNTDLVEIIENKSHPWFIGVQFHPEYKSSVSNPHPLFVNFVGASLKNYLNNN